MDKAFLNRSLFVGALVVAVAAVSSSMGSYTTARFILNHPEVTPRSPINTFVRSPFFSLTQDRYLERKQQAYEVEAMIKEAQALHGAAPANEVPKLDRRAYGRAYRHCQFLFGTDILFSKREINCIDNILNGVDAQ